MSTDAAVKPKLIPPYGGRRAVLFTNFFLFLEAFPIFLLMRGFYITGVILIGAYYAVNSYTEMGKFLLRNVPRQRLEYRIAPALWIAAVGTSFLPKSWNWIVVVIILGMGLYISLRTIKQKRELIDFSNPAS